MSTNKTIKFFISSTFKDFEKERDILHKFVFPKLKDLCHSNGFGFQPVDLRWGVMEEASHDQQTMNICLNEIKRSSYAPKPNLLLLVGQRYGWIPIPYDIEVEEFKEIINKVSVKNRALIENWYKLDENAIPHTYYLRDKYEYKDDRDGWTAIENQIREAFKNATTIERYHTSATEQEMAEGLNAFSIEVDHKHTFAYFRTIENYENVKEKKNDFIDNDLGKIKKLSKKLQDRSNIPKDNQIIPENNVKWHDIEEAIKTKYENLALDSCPVYLKNFHDEIYERFNTTIQEEINKYKSHSTTDLEVELEEQQNFLDTKSKIVVGRDEEVGRIIHFVKNENEPAQYYLQYGKSGSGKTSVMAKAIFDLTDKDSKDKLSSKYQVLYRFIGVSSLSTYSKAVYESIYWEIETVIFENNKKIEMQSLALEHDDQKFKEQFRNQLQKLIDKDKIIIIFLDALDQFGDYNDLSILLEKLPKNVKIIFSTLYDENKLDIEDYYKYYNRLEYLDKKYLLEPLKQENQINLLNQWLDPYCDKNNKTLIPNIKRRALTKTQFKYIKTVLSKGTSKTPLFLKLVFEIVKHWNSEKIECKLAHTEEELIIQFFEFIQKQYHHKKSLMSYTLGLISASKDGLSEEELIDLFSKNLEFLEEFQNDRYQYLDRFPVAIWSRFYYYIQDFFTEKLIDTEMLIIPFHRVISETIRNVYYHKDLHRNLADYFLTLQDETKIWDERYNNSHMLSETSYQLFHAKDTQRLQDILFDLEYVGSVYNQQKQNEFINILKKSINLEGINESIVRTWISFYRTRNHLINMVREKNWKPHQSLFQLAYEAGVDSLISKQADKLLEDDKIKFLWYKNYNRPKKYHEEGLIQSINMDEDYIIEILELNTDTILVHTTSGVVKLFTIEGYHIKSIYEFKGSKTEVLKLNTGKFLFASDKGMSTVWGSDGKLLSTCNIFISNAIELENKLILNTNELIIWNFQDNKFINMLTNSKRVRYVKKLNDNSILTHYDDNSVEVWDNDMSIVQFTFSMKMTIDNCIVLESKKFLFNDRTSPIVYIYNRYSDSIEYMNEHSSEVLGIIQLKNHKIITYDMEGTIIFHSADMKTKKRVSTHKSWIEGIVELKNGNILSYSHDSMIIIWSDEGELIKKVEIHTGSISEVKQLLDKRIISFSPQEGNLLIWSLDDYVASVIRAPYQIQSFLELSNKRILTTVTNSSYISFCDVQDSNISLDEWNSFHWTYVPITIDGKFLKHTHQNKLYIWDDHYNKKSVVVGYKKHENSIEFITEEGEIYSYTDKNILKKITNAIYTSTSFDSMNSFTEMKDFPRNFIKDAGSVTSDEVRTIQLTEDKFIYFNKERYSIINNHGELIKEFRAENILNIFKINSSSILLYTDTEIKFIDFFEQDRELFIKQRYYLDSCADDDEILSIERLKENKFVSFSEKGVLNILDLYEFKNFVQISTGSKIKEIKVVNEKFLTFSESNEIKLWDFNGNILEKINFPFPLKSTTISAKEALFTYEYLNFNMYLLHNGQIKIDFNQLAKIMCE